MTPISKYAVGLRYGLIAGIVYVVLLFCRFKFFSYSPQVYFYFSMVSFLIILFVYLLAGIARKKELGGIAHVREIFQSIFVTILITEAFYVLFVFAYMKFIDPEFFQHFRQMSLVYYQKIGLTPDEMNMSMKGVDSLINQEKPGGLVKGYGFSVILDSIIGFLIAFILRKQNPITGETKQL